MSNISPANINNTFPTPGRDNDSQGLRDNFGNIKTNFEVARSEITELQSKAVLKSAIDGQLLNNDMGGSILSNVRIDNARTTAISKGVMLDAVVVDLREGQYHTFTTGGPVFLEFTGWPAKGQFATVRVEIVLGGTGHYIQLPESVRVGTDKIAGLDSSNRLTLDYTADNPDPGEVSVVNTFIFDFSTHTRGEIIAINDLSRPRDMEVPDEVLASVALKADADTVAELFASVTGVPAYSLVRSAKQGPLEYPWFYTPYQVPDVTMSGGSPFYISAGPWDFRAFCTVLTPWSGTNARPYCAAVFEDFSSLPRKPLTELNGLGFWPYKTADQFFMEKMQQPYFTGTFGPTGLNREAGNFVTVLWTSAATIAPRSNTKSGAALRWDINETIVSNNNFPGYTLTSSYPAVLSVERDDEQVTIPVGFIYISSVDGFSGVTDLDLASFGLECAPMIDVAYWPNLVNLNLDNNYLGNHLSNWMIDVASKTAAKPYVARTLSITGEYQKLAASTISSVLPLMQAAGWSVIYTNSSGVTQTATRVT